MTPASAFGLLAFTVACTRGTSPSAEAGRDAAATSPPAASASATKATLATLCGADQLPRLDESRLGLEAMREAATRGTVALTWNESRAQTLPDCTLPGSYTEVNGSGGGRFFATNRVLMRTDEIDTKCGRATHLVAAYVTWRDTETDRIAAILVPLPCPSASDPAPAPGCV